MATAALDLSPPTFSHTRDRARLAVWLLCWVLLPNLGFWLLWLFGAPPRPAEILATGAIGLLVRRLSRRIQFAVFVLALAWSALSYLSAVFNLAITEIVVSVGFLLELKPIGSIEYLSAALFAVGLLIGAWQAFRLPLAFTSTAHLAVAVGAIAAAAGLDYAVSLQSNGAYGRLAGANTPFSSATSQADLLARADGSRHIILVMVEALGQPVDPALRRALFGRWAQADITARYTVRQGITPYYGSTTSGELRELCGRWDDYASVSAADDPRCLPARMRSRGYETSAVHSFTGALFDRELWYPHIGFDRQIFRDTLMRAGARPCVSVFPGVCDRDVPAILARKLKGATRPQFLYWLTVNSHLPVPAAAALGTEDCLERRPDFAIRNGSICRLATVIAEVNDALAKVLVAPDFPDADILVVGDHMPPFFDHGSRAQFEPGQVPWILLTRRTPGQAPHPAN